MEEMEENKPDKAVRKKSAGKIILAITAAIMLIAVTTIAVLIVLKVIDSRKPDFFLGDMNYVKYAKDGKHVFIVQVNLNGGSDVGADYWLFYTTPDFKDPKFISSGVKNVQVSPSGKYILYYNWDSEKLTVFDVANFKAKVEYDGFASEEYGWNPNEKEIWYTTSKGIFTKNLKTSKEKKIISGPDISDPNVNYTPFGWSDDGRYFTYEINSRTFAINNRKQTEKLFIYDNKKQESKVLCEKIDGKTTDIMVLNNKAILVGLSYKKDGYSELKQYSFDSKKWIVLWAKKPRELLGRSEGFLVSDFKLDKTRNNLLFLAKSQTYDEPFNGIYQMDLLTSKATKLVSNIEEGEWDYNPKTNKIIWFDYKEEKLKEKQLN